MSCDFTWAQAFAVACVCAFFGGALWAIVAIIRAIEGDRHE